MAFKVGISIGNAEARLGPFETKCLLRMSLISEGSLRDLLFTFSSFID